MYVRGLVNARIEVEVADDTVTLIRTSLSNLNRQAMSFNREEWDRIVEFVPRLFMARTAALQTAFAMTQQQPSMPPDTTAPARDGGE